MPQSSSRSRWTPLPPHRRPPWSHQYPTADPYIEQMALKLKEDLHDKNPDRQVAAAKCLAALGARGLPAVLSRVEGLMPHPEFLRGRRRRRLPNRHEWRAHHGYPACSISLKGGGITCGPKCSWAKSASQPSTRS